MKAAYIVAILLISTYFQSCIFGAYDKKLNGGYYLSATDVNDDMSLGYEDNGNGVGIIDATVYAVGQNDNFIIVKRHPRSMSKADRNIKEYYIIPLKNRISQSADKNLYGPMSQDEFQQKVKELHVGTISFSIVFKDLS